MTNTCPVCGESTWENIDHLRGIQDEFKNIMDREYRLMMCVKCGMVQYHTDKTEEEILDYYKREARNAPTAEGLFQAQYKSQYHSIFLKEVFARWVDEKKIPVIFDVGSAFGFFPAWCKKNMELAGLTADVSGSELTRTYVRVAWHDFGIRLIDEIDETKKYDMISCYKVHEHQMNPYDKLLKYKSLLKDDGYLYISIPIYFSKMELHGETGFGLQQYYHTNHINMWTRKNYETMLRKAGLKVIKQDHVLYGSTYLCKKAAEGEDLGPIEYDSPEEIKKRMDAICRSFARYNEQDFAGALEIFPNFPSCWHRRYEMDRNRLHKMGWDSIQEVLDAALKACPDSVEVLSFVVDVYQRYENYEPAIKLIERRLEINPNEIPSLCILQNAYRLLAMKSTVNEDIDKYYGIARKIGEKISELSLKYKVEQISFRFYDNSRRPTPWELESYLNKQKEN